MTGSPGGVKSHVFSSKGLGQLLTAITFPDGPVARALAPNTGDLGSIPGQGIRSHLLQRRLKIPRAATKIQSNQIKFKKKKESKER